MDLMKLFEDWAPIGALYGALVFALAKWVSPLVAQYIPQITVTMSTIDVNIRQAVATGKTGALASLILGYFNLNLGMPDFVMLLISSVVLVVAGALIYSFFPVGKSLWHKLAAVFLYGSIAEGLVLGVFTGLNFAMASIVLTMMAYAVVVSVIMILVVKYVPGLKLPAMK